MSRQEPHHHKTGRMIRKRKARRGVSLVEVVAATAVGSVMVGVAVSMLYMLLSLDRQARGELRRRTALAALAQQFRNDVRAATDFGVVDPPPGQAGAAVVWELRLADGHVVRYSRPGDDLRREERLGGSTLRRELFALSEHVDVTIEPTADERPFVISLRLTPGELPVEKPAVRPLRIDAALGADHRFTNSPEP